MGWRFTETSTKDTLTCRDVKLCELCGCLNHKTNSDCFLCGWKGSFSSDQATIKMAWERLFNEFERVAMEHVTRGRKTPIDELGVIRKASWPIRCAKVIRQYFSRVRTHQTQPDSRRQSHLTGPSGPPNELTS